MTLHPCRTLLCALLLQAACTPSLLAQVFIRVSNPNDLKHGDKVIIVGQPTKNPQSLLVVTTQAKTGTSVTCRYGAKVEPDEQGQIVCTDQDVAVFTLQKEDNVWRFYDERLSAYLAYSTKKPSGTDRTSLFTLTSSELAANASTHFNTFTLGYKDKWRSYILSYKSINKYPSGTAKFGLYFSSTNSAFRLYDNALVSADSVFCYRERIMPALSGTDSGDYTATGDWSAADFSTYDFSQAQRIDFTQANLPAGGFTLPAAQLPHAYVWTYVKAGQGKYLPAAWPNVIEVSANGGDVPGRAITAIQAGEGTTLGAKYAFTTAAGLGICWSRPTYGQEGWYTLALPFAPQQVCYSSGEPAAITRLAYESCNGQEAVFRELPATAPWVAGEAYLWKPGTSAQDEVLFKADKVTVLCPSPFPSPAEGLHACGDAQVIEDAHLPLYLLLPDGSGFGAALAGSTLHAARAYLRLPASSATSLRLLVTPPTGMPRTVCPEYNDEPCIMLNGIIQGSLRKGQPIPAHWPKGVYITPTRKILHRP